jgi:hypothetical protein
VPSVHKHPPIAYRPPEDVRDRLLALRDEHDEPMNATITKALREYFGMRADDGKASPAAQ